MISDQKSSTSLPQARCGMPLAALPLFYMESAQMKYIPLSGRGKHSQQEHARPIT